MRPNHLLGTSLFIFYAASLLVTLGCAESADVVTPVGNQIHVLPEIGKADNYYSTNAREFILSGVAHVTLPDDFGTLEGDARTSRLTSLVDSRQSLVVRSIQDHIREALTARNEGKTGEDAEYFIYVKRGAGSDDATEVLGDGRARFEFEFELIGHSNLIPAVAPAGDARFEIEVKEWPSPTGEKVTVLVNPTASSDSFPKYNELFADDVLDIAVHFGGDYNEGRHDLETAKWLVSTLLEEGWKNESVRGYETLAIDSPPFTRELEVEGRTIAVKAYVYHSDMVTPEQETELSRVMKESLATRDVVIYSGHAGENAGFILDYQPKHELTPSEFATVPMASKYQIFVLDGCRTYRTYVDDLLKNPAKTFDNLNIITTVNTTPFSVGYQVLWEMMFWLTLTNDEGAHYPLSWNALLAGINTDDFKTVHYGVHGVDNGPKLNPHGGSPACTPCEADSGCGAGGNMCLGYGSGNACGVACTTDDACGPGFKCQSITEDAALFYLPKQCVRTSRSCAPN
jgi:hypothetical protein